MTDTLYIALEAVFNRDAQGNIWSDAGFEPSFWQRYLAAFEKIAIVARMNDVSRQAPPHLIIPGEKISFVALPYYRGVGGFLGKTFGLLHRLNRISSRSGYFILRLPGAIGMLLGCLRAMRQGRFAVEMVGDPYDVLSGEGFSTRDRLLRGPLTLVTKLLCRGSIGNTYVTEHTLQGRYPPAKGAYCDGISSINLPPSQFSATAKVQGGVLPFRLFFCGSLAQLYKGLDVLVEAVALLKGKHRDISVTVAGDGLYRGKMEALAKDKGVADRFIFRGQIARGEVFAALDEADMFVMPSRTEGLPRAMVEAMARGMCCIGTFRSPLRVTAFTGARWRRSRKTREWQTVSSFGDKLRATTSSRHLTRQTCLSCHHARKACRGRWWRRWRAERAALGREWAAFPNC